MKERFEGKEGKRLLIEALRGQTVAEGRQDIAEQLADLAQLKEFAAGDEIMRQDAEDNHVSLIVSGSVSIVVHGHEVNRRIAGQHVGEMALIDPSALRSASVVARETTVSADITEPDFTRIAERNPRMWRLLALELGERLRQRNDLVPVMNDQPIIFIGSSAENLPIANEIQSGLDHDPFVVRVWSKGVFGASNFPIEDLEQQVSESDFAILIFGADDVVISREVEKNAPRDNVVFELGLFMGALKRQRSYIVKPRGLDIKIPTDLIGLNVVEFAEGDPKDLPANIGPVCTEIRKLVLDLGPK